jgi:hypothetical protein
MDEGVDQTETSGAGAVTDLRPFADLSHTGMLWLINRVVFHPRGFALTLHIKGGEATGWHLQGDGTEPWTFTADDDDERFKLVEELFAGRREHLAKPRREDAIE